MIELAPQHKTGLVLAHPALNASGMLGFVPPAAWPAGLGGFITNPLTWFPRTPARPPNAVLGGDGGVLIHTGLPNPGVIAAVRHFGRAWARSPVPVIVHVAATTPTDVRRALSVLERVDGPAGLELGLRDDVTPTELAALVRAALGTLPLLVRLPPATALSLAPLAVRAGANALTLAAPPRHTLEAHGQTVTGRWYAPTELPATLNLLSAVLAALPEPVPLIAAGGVFTPADQAAALTAGATAVQWDAALWQLWPTSERV